MRHLLRLPLMALTLFVAGCLQNDRVIESTNSSNSVTTMQTASLHTGDGFTAFKSSLHPLVLSQCASCHGANQAPQFAAKDADSAYETVTRLNLVNFQGGVSRLVTKSNDGHCGAGCLGKQEQFVAAIQQWWSGGECRATNGCGNNVGQATQTLQGVVLPAMKVPATVNGTAWTTLTWPLSAVDPALTGMNFVVEIQLFTGSNAYLLRRPRFTIPANSPDSIYAERISVAVNGKVDPNATTYELVERVVSAPGGQLLSLSTMLILRDKGPGVDEVRLGFAQLKKSLAACKAQTVFVQTVKPVIVASCQGCHGTGNPLNYAAGTSDDLLCVRSLQRVDLSNPVVSPLVALPRDRQPTRGGGAHPAVTNAPSSAQWDAVIQWAKTEAQ